MAVGGEGAPTRAPEGVSLPTECLQRGLDRRHDITNGFVGGERRHVSVSMVERR